MSSISFHHQTPLLAVGACSLAFVAAIGTVGYAQRTAQDGVYTEAQAARGLPVYRQYCARCHGASLQGLDGPPLAGETFVAQWSGPLVDLATKIRKTMPADAAGTLSPQQTADIIAYILQFGKFPSGKTELAGDEAALKSVAMSPSRGPASPATALAATPSVPAAGNLQMVMRGILFPSSNLIFNVQTYDPGAKRTPKPGQKQNAGFSWTDWGADMYTPWEMVDYAAIAVAESAALLLTPGRLCENGKPVPVERPDWIKYSLEMAEAGRAAYKASQSRNQEAVSDSTNQLSESCLNCHQVYRDKPGGKVNRCIPPSR